MDPHQDDGPPPEDDARPDRDRDTDTDTDPEDAIDPIEEDPDAGNEPEVEEPGPDLSIEDPMLGTFPGF